MAEKGEAEKVTEHEDLNNYSDEYLLETALRIAGNLAVANSGQGPFSSTESGEELKNFSRAILGRMKRECEEEKPSVKDNDLNDACGNMPDA